MLAGVQPRVVAMLEGARADVPAFAEFQARQ